MHASESITKRMSLHYISPTYYRKERIYILASILHTYHGNLVEALKATVYITSIVAEDDVTS